METTETSIVLKSTADLPVVYDPFKKQMAELQTAYDEALKLEITDSKSYDAVHEARMKLKNFRIAVDKKRQELNKDALDWQRSNNKLSDEITDWSDPKEKELKIKQDAWDEKEKQRKEKEKKDAEEKLNNRIKQLARYSASHDVVALGAMNETAFELLLEDHKHVFEKEKTKTKRIEFLDKICQSIEVNDAEYYIIGGVSIGVIHLLNCTDVEFMVEANKLRDEKKRLADVAKAEKERLERDLKRREEVTKLGAVLVPDMYDSPTYVLGDQSIPEKSLLELEEDKYISELELFIITANRLAEKKKTDEAEVLRQKKENENIAAALKKQQEDIDKEKKSLQQQKDTRYEVRTSILKGYGTVTGRAAFKENNEDFISPNGESSMRSCDVYECDDIVFNKFADDCKIQHEEVIKQNAIREENEKRLAAERKQKRTAQLAPDKEKLSAYITALITIKCDPPKHSDAQTLMINFEKNLKALCDKLATDSINL